MGKLFYSFLSLAASRDTSGGRLVPVEGMKLVAAQAHRYGIPVTWIVDSYSVQESGEIISQGHAEYGDEVILQIDVSSVLENSGVARPESKAEEIVILRQNLPDYIISQRKIVRDMLPWSEVNIVAADVKSDALVEILENLDFIGLWGYHWSGDGDDRGCPWSFFHASRDHYNAPAQYNGGLMAVESTSLDLNSVFYSGNARVFSAGPDDLRMSGLYADKNVAYGKSLLNEYLNNCDWNRFLMFLQQQPAHEMEYENYKDYDGGCIEDIASIMGEFFREAASNPDIEPVSLPRAINAYRNDFEHTEACYMAFDGIVPLDMNISYHVPPVPEQKPPYPFTFFYYDRECQMVFREGQMTPVEIRNYLTPPFESKSCLEKEIPSISSFRPDREREKLILEFEIESVKRMPFGLVIWDDHSTFSLVSSNARLVKWVGDHLLFIRIDLEEGLNRTEVSLTI